jgi:glycosyltransferase involved in cell wall biosynthesis
MSSVDVIVPCYNYARFLRECVQSVLTQEGVAVRVLIIDDASQDDTETVGRTLAAEDPRVEFRRHAVNRGHIATYNEGIEWLSGDYALLLSADDLLTSGALGRAAELMNEHSEVGFVFGRAIKTATPGTGAVIPEGRCERRILSGTEFLNLSCKSGANHVPTPTLVVRTTLQHELGGYKPELPHTGDLEICCRFAAHAAVGVLDADQAYYRVHGNNMHKDTFADAMTVLEQHREGFRILFEEQGYCIADRQRLRRLATRAIARSALHRACKAFDAGDDRACASFLQYAITHYPPLRKESAWLRLSLKRTIGFKVWRAVRPTLRFFRRTRNPLDPSPFATTGIFSGV